MKMRALFILFNIIKQLLIFELSPADVAPEMADSVVLTPVYNRAS
jgi:hypothetical protein